MKEIDQKTVIWKQIDAVYNYNDVVNALNEKTDMSVFCKTFGIGQYKTINGSRYVVLKTTESFCFVVFDDEEKNGTIFPIEFLKEECLDAFIDLDVGMTLKDVQKIDPNGKYDFLLHSWSKYPKFSYHCFETGDCYFINYNEEHIIDVIIHFTI